MGNIFCIHPSIDCSACIHFVNDMDIHSGWRIDNGPTPRLINFPFPTEVSGTVVSSYLNEVIKAVNSGDHVIVTSIMAVREGLHQRGYTYYLIYPHNSKEIGIDFKHDLTDHKLQLYQGERLEELLVMNLTRSKLGFSRINVPSSTDMLITDSTGWKSVIDIN